MATLGGRHPARPVACDGALPRRSRFWRYPLGRRADHRCQRRRSDVDLARAGAAPGPHRASEDQRPGGITCAYAPQKSIDADRLIVCGVPRLRVPRGSQHLLSKKSLPTRATLSAFRRRIGRHARQARRAGTRRGAGRRHQPHRLAEPARQRQLESVMALDTVPHDRLAVDSGTWVAAMVPANSLCGTRRRSLSIPLS